MLFSHLVLNRLFCHIFVVENLYMYTGLSFNRELRCIFLFPEEIFSLELP